VIFGVAVVFPVVITFGVDSPGVAPGKANSYRRCAPVNNVPANVPAPRAGTLLVIPNSNYRRTQSADGLWGTKRPTEHTKFFSVQSK